MRLQTLDLRAGNLTVIIYGKQGEDGEIAKMIAFRCTGDRRKCWKLADRKSDSDRRASTVTFIDETDAYWVIVRRGTQTVLLYPPCGGYVEVYPAGALCTCQVELLTEAGQPAFLEHGSQGCRHVRFADSNLQACSV